MDQGIKRRDLLIQGDGDPAIVNKQIYWESNGQITRRIRV